MDIPLRQFVEEEYAIVRGLRPKATYQVRLTFARWAEFLGREPVVADLTNLSVQKFLAHRKTKVSMGTTLKDRNQIVGVWNYLAKQDRTLPFPTLPPMSPVRRVPKAYTVEDVSRLLRVSLALPGAVAGLPRGLWWASLQRVCWESAERISAVLAATWDDVDLDARSITFRAENRKGGRADIQRDISAETAGWLADLRQGRSGDDRVWPWDRNASTLWLEHNRIAALAQVTARGFHGFRRSCASYLTLAAGLAAASEQLGHASTEMTRSRYCDPTIARPAVSPVDMLPRLDLGPPPSRE